MDKTAVKKPVPGKCRGRPSSFNRNELLSQVMELFWDQGYNNLSLNKIAKATGLTRASLYNAFRTKEALFLEVVGHYLADSPDKVFKNIGKGDRIGPIFYLFFSEVSKNLSTNGKQRGCLAVNCISELSPCNSELGEQIANVLEDQRTRMKFLIRQAVEQKELPEHTEPAITANIIQTFLSGLSIFSKTGATEKTLRTMSHIFLRNIGFMDPESHTTGGE